MLITQIKTGQAVRPPPVLCQMIQLIGTVYYCSETEPTFCIYTDLIIQSLHDTDPISDPYPQKSRTLAPPPPTPPQILLISAINPKLFDTGFIFGTLRSRAD